MRWESVLGRGVCEVCMYEVVRCVSGSVLGRGIWEVCEVVSV